MFSFQQICDALFGASVRNIPVSRDSVYLTFDDGPDPTTTPLVLDLLAQKNAKATFFVIGTQAKAYPDILKRIVREGHAVGDHSWDHRYYRFFLGKRSLKKWITNSQRNLFELTGTTPVGFRSPAGVRTPELHAALDTLNIPLIHWNQRCYDTLFTFNPRKARKLLFRIHEGDILLLHDHKQAKQLTPFLQGLECLLDGIINRNLKFSKL